MDGKEVRTKARLQDDLSKDIAYVCNTESVCKTNHYLIMYNISDQSFLSKLRKISWPPITSLHLQPYRKFSYCEKRNFSPKNAPREILKQKLFYYSSQWKPWRIVYNIILHLNDGCFIFQSSHFLEIYLFLSGFLGGIM